MSLVRFNLWLLWTLLVERYQAVHACDLDTGFAAALATGLRRKPLVYDMFDMYTEAAHGLCSGIPRDHQQHLTAKDCGHYGIFSGRRWREYIYPQIRDFIHAHEQRIGLRRVK